MVWQLVPFADILRTKLNAIPVKEGAGWKKGVDPERAATEARAKELLRAAGIGSNGQAMVSSGLSPCGEPCQCGAGRSKHLDGVAADLNTADMATLTKIKVARPVTRVLKVAPALETFRRQKHFAWD